MEYKNEYRRSIDEYKPAIPVKRKIGLYWILAILRIALVFAPQTGYIHPDEYFQSVEVISGDHFDIDVFKPWEFNATFPIRNVFIPQLTVGLPYSILKCLSPYTFRIFGISLRSPYFLVLFPRILMCALSFLSDYCLYKICFMYGQNYKVRLITFASSYIMFTYATRIFSNSIELLLVSVLLYYTAECMAYSEKVVLQSDYLSDKYSKAKTGVERVKYYKLKACLPSHSLNHCFKLATITVTGIFNRPTFVAFALAPIFFWLQRGLGSKSVGFADFHIRIFTYVLCGIPTAIFFILVDSFYYGYLTLAEIGSLQLSLNNFVVTPLNFLKYNANTKNLEHHGLHPRFVHFVINIPLLYNALGIIGLIAFGKMCHSIVRGRWLDVPRIQSIVGLMTLSFIIPILLLSMVPHQEPRFIIPTILPLVFLYAPKLSQVPGVDTISRIANQDRCDASVVTEYRPNKLQLLWYVCNIGLASFYGFVHQAGVLPLTAHIANELRAKPHLTHVHLYTSYIYSMPTALLHLRNTRKTYISGGKHKYRLIRDFYLYEQGSKNITEVYNNIALKLRECDNKFTQKKVPYRIYYALPTSAVEEFIEYSFQNNTNHFNYHTVTTFYPHLSTEKLFSAQVINNAIGLHETSTYGTKSIIEIGNSMCFLFKQFGLTLMKIEKSISGIT